MAFTFQKPSGLTNEKKIPVETKGQIMEHETVILNRKNKAKYM